MKTAKKRKEASINQEQSSNVIPIALQQLVLNVFRGVYVTSINETLPTLIQEVKQHLFNRDFTQAFGQSKYLEAYALRWSCGRSLMYLDVFARLSCFRDIFAKYKRESKDGVGLPIKRSSHHSVPNKTANHPKGPRVVCVGGGGGGELVALAAYLHFLDGSEGCTEPKSSESLTETKLTIVDIADWSEVIQRLYHGIITAPSLSKFASSKSKASARALINTACFSIEFVRQDILKAEVEHLSSLLQDVELVTIMFTLNELYSTSVSDTTNFLLSMTCLIAPGTLLLVIDSPGSYSTVSVGKTLTAVESSEEKKYPMQWLLDHTLLEASAIGSSKLAAQERQWEKVEDLDSRWCRLKRELIYPIDLEDMRYQLHLYRRL